MTSHDCINTIRKVFNIKKKTTPLVYLSLGQESIPAAISESIKKPYVLAQHRGHGIYLAFDGDPKKLRDELLNGEIFATLHGADR